MSFTIVPTRSRTFVRRLAQMIILHKIRFGDHNNKENVESKRMIFTKFFSGSVLGFLSVGSTSDDDFSLGLPEYFVTAFFGIFLKNSSISGDWVAARIRLKFCSIKRPGCWNKDRSSVLSRPAIPHKTFGIFMLTRRACIARNKQ